MSVEATCDNVTKELITDVLKDVVGEEFAKMREESLATTPVRKYTENMGDLLQVKADQMKDQKNTGGLLSRLHARRNGGEAPGTSAAKSIRVLYEAGFDPYRAIEIAHRMGDEKMAEGFEKAVLQTSFTNGGAAIPVEFAAEVIELLEANSIALSDQTMIDDLNAVKVMPYVSADSTSTWTTESANRSSSNPTTGQITMTEHFLSTIVPVSNHWLRNAGNDNMIRNSMLRSMRQKLDITLIRSLGVASEPFGFRGLQANTFAANATLNVANATADGARAKRELMDNNVDVNNPDTKWRFAPRTHQALYQLRDSSGTGYAFREELDKGLWLGLPYGITSQIPTNQGAGSNESDIYLVHDPLMVFGLGQDMSVQLYPGGAYYNGSSVISGIAQNQTVFAIEMACDFAATQRGAEIVYISAVKWAA
jgi:HK97 family phage major capsid protein